MKNVKNLKDVKIELKNKILESKKALDYIIESESKMNDMWDGGAIVISPHPHANRFYNKFHLKNEDIKEFMKPYIYKCNFENQYMTPFMLILQVVCEELIDEN